MDRQSVTEKALGIFDLAETIIRHLSPRDILRAARINKNFASVVQHSVYIQRLLFLRPTAPYTPTGKRIEYTSNPLFDLATFAGHRISLKHNDLSYYPCPSIELVNSDCEHTALLVTARPNDGRSSLQHTYDGQVSSGSWEGMLLTQPPCDVWLEIRDLGIGYHQQFNLWVVLAKPTMGEMVDVVRRVYETGVLDGLKLVPRQEWKSGYWVPPCRQCQMGMLKARNQVSV